MHFIQQFAKVCHRQSFPLYGTTTFREYRDLANSCNKHIVSEDTDSYKWLKWNIKIDESI